MSSPTVEVPVPTVEDVKLDEVIPSGRTAKELVDRRQSLKAEIELCEQEIKDIDTELRCGLDFRNLRKVVCDKWLVIQRQGAKPRPILDRILLLEAGVTPQQLEAGTKTSEAGKPGITIQDLTKPRSNRWNTSVIEE